MCAAWRIDGSPRKSKVFCKLSDSLFTDNDSPTKCHAVTCDSSTCHGWFDSLSANEPKSSCLFANIQETSLISESEVSEFRFTTALISSRVWVVQSLYIHNDFSLLLSQPRWEIHVQGATRLRDSLTRCKEVVHNYFFYTHAAFSRRESRQTLAPSKNADIVIL